MISSTPYPPYRFENIKRDIILDKKGIGVEMDKIEWKQSIPFANQIIVPPKSQIDNFKYPSLNKLRREFKVMGLYNKNQIDKIIEAYARLPKYRAKGNGSSGGNKRS